jgi:hypothetical protein
MAQYTHAHSPPTIIPNRLRSSHLSIQLSMLDVPLHTFYHIIMNDEDWQLSHACWTNKHQHICMQQTHTHHSLVTYLASKAWRGSNNVVSGHDSSSSSSYSWILYRQRWSSASQRHPHYNKSLPTSIKPTIIRKNNEMRHHRTPAIKWDKTTECFRRRRYNWQTRHIARRPLKSSDIRDWVITRINSRILNDQ